MNKNDCLKNNFFAIDKSRLKIKTLYYQLQLEKCDIEDFENSIGTFSIQILRLRSDGLISSDHAKSYNNFIRILKQLHNNIKPKRLESILKKAEEWKLLAERKWLIEKAKEKMK